MIKARKAEPADTNELIRLRGVMFTGLHDGEPADNGWRETWNRSTDHWASPERQTPAMPLHLHPADT